MSDTVLKVENLYKRYRLGAVGAASFGEDLQRLWAKVQGKPDPFEQYISANELSAIKSADEMKAHQARYVWALQDINFEVKQGEILGVIGKNGAGKSTLLKILSKTTAPTRGEVKVKGRVASLLEVGTGFHPELTGRENIFLNGHILGMNRHEIRARMDEIIDFAGIEAYLDTPVKRYSSGMYVRLAFAVAAHLLADILIVDEVLAVGDAEFQKKCIGKMKDVSAGEGRTVLFVSHNMAAVENLCNTALILKKGFLFEIGTVKNAVKKHLLDMEYISQIPISKITDRTGNGLLKFLDIRFLDKENIEKKIFEVGEQLNIEISFDISEDFYALRSSRIDIGINNFMGTRVLWLSSSIYFDKINPTSRNIIFKLQKILLVQGSYNVNLFCDTNKGVADWISNVAKFEVIMTDYFGTGRIFPDNQGYIVADYSIKN